MTDPALHEEEDDALCFRLVMRFLRRERVGRGGLLRAEGRQRERAESTGGEFQRLALSDAEPAARQSRVDVLALSDALDQLEAKDARKAALVKLRYFAGLTNEEAAAALGVSTATADNDWAYAKSWLRLKLGNDSQKH